MHVEGGRGEGEGGGGRGEDLVYTYCRDYTRVHNLCTNNHMHRVMSEEKQHDCARASSYILMLGAI